MSFTKTVYDIDAYKLALSQSVGPGVYKLGKPQTMCEPCYPYAPTVRLDRVGDSVLKNANLVDVDSELIGITRKYSREPSKKYIPQCVDSVCNSGEVCGQGVVDSCGLGHGRRPGDENLLHFKDCFQPAEQSRMTNPSCNLRGHGWNRWEWLCHDPQEMVDRPFQWNVSNRILVKDNHRPCIPKPLDQTPVLPRGGTLPCEPITATCANFTLPMSVAPTPKKM